MRHRTWEIVELSDFALKCQALAKLGWFDTVGMVWHCQFGRSRMFRMTPQRFPGDRQIARFTARFTVGFTASFDVSWFWRSFCTRQILANVLLGSFKHVLQLFWDPTSSHMDCAIIPVRLFAFPIDSGKKKGCGLVSMGACPPPSTWLGNSGWSTQGFQKRCDNQRTQRMFRIKKKQD